MCYNNNDCGIRNAQEFKHIETVIWVLLLWKREKGLYEYRGLVDKGIFCIYTEKKTTTTVDR